MSNVFLFADPHFGHRGIVKFLNADGSKVRPWDDVDQMNEDMVQRWNSVVRPKDKVYLGGDVVINRKSLEVVGRLNGDKILIKGNHDIFRLKDYTEHFRDIRSYQIWVGCGIIFSHIPLYESQLERFGTNVHGHLHGGRVRRADGSIHPGYFCVCAEHVNYTPISLEDVKSAIVAQGGFIGPSNAH